MLKVYCWLTICHTKWRLQGSTMLTYFGNCASPDYRHISLETVSRHRRSTIHGYSHHHTITMYRDTCTRPTIRVCIYSLLSLYRTSGSRTKTLQFIMIIRIFARESLATVSRHRRSTIHGYSHHHTITMYRDTCTRPTIRVCIHVCSGSVMVTAYDFESGRPGSNHEWG